MIKTKEPNHGVVPITGPLNYVPEIVDLLEAEIEALKKKYPIVDFRIDLADVGDKRYEPWREAGRVRLPEKHPLAIFDCGPKSTVQYTEK